MVKEKSIKVKKTSKKDTKEEVTKSEEKAPTEIEIKMKIIDEIKELATEHNITLYNEIIFKVDFENKPKIGGVYGFIIDTNGKPIKNIIKNIKKNNADHVVKQNTKYITPIMNSLYNLYWGKDKYLFARYFSHMTKRGLSKNANIHLEMIKEILKPYAVYFISFIVSDNTEMEKKLQEKYPNILKTL